jgi:hypothetical protein
MSSSLQLGTISVTAKGKIQNSLDTLELTLRS